MKKKATVYSKIDGFYYKNGYFGAGLVKYSKHPINKVYLKINDDIFELRIDEVHAIISSLATSLWSDYQLTKGQKVKLKWKTQAK